MLLVLDSGMLSIPGVGCMGIPEIKVMGRVANESRGIKHIIWHLIFIVFVAEMILNNFLVL